MEQPPPKPTVEIPPDLSETTPVTADFPNVPNPIDMTEVDIARSQATATRQRVYSLITELSRLQERLSSDLGFENEVDNLQATRRWADEVLDVAFELSAKAGRLVDDIDDLVPRLEGGKEELGDEEENSEEVDMMQVDVQSGETAKDGGEEAR